MKEFNHLMIGLLGSHLGLERIPTVKSWVIRKLSLNLFISQGPMEKVLFCDSSNVLVCGYRIVSLLHPI